MTQSPGLVIQVIKCKRSNRHSLLSPATQSVAHLTEVSAAGGSLLEMENQAHVLRKLGNLWRYGFVRELECVPLWELVGESVQAVASTSSVESSLQRRAPEGTTRAHRIHWDLQGNLRFQPGDASVPQDAGAVDSGCRHSPTHIRGACKPAHRPLLSPSEHSTVPVASLLKFTRQSFPAGAHLDPAFLPLFPYSFEPRWSSF